MLGALGQGLISSLSWVCSKLRQIRLQRTNMEPEGGPFQRTVICKGPLFRFHVSFQECKWDNFQTVFGGFCAPISLCRCPQGGLLGIISQRSRVPIGRCLSGSRAGTLPARAMPHREMPNWPSTLSCLAQRNPNRRPTSTPAARPQLQVWA